MIKYLIVLVLLTVPAFADPVQGKDGLYQISPPSSDWKVDKELAGFLMIDLAFEKTNLMEDGLFNVVIDEQPETEQELFTSCREGSLEEVKPSEEFKERRKIKSKTKADVSGQFLRLCGKQIPTIPFAPEVCDFSLCFFYQDKAFHISAWSHNNKKSINSAEKFINSFELLK